MIDSTIQYDDYGNNYHDDYFDDYLRNYADDYSESENLPS